MDVFLNRPSLNPAIDILESQLEIAQAFNVDCPEYLAGLARALQCLRSIRAADEIIAQWSFTPEPDPELPAADADPKTY